MHDTDGADKFIMIRMDSEHDIAGTELDRLRTVGPVDVELLAQQRRILGDVVASRRALTRGQIEAVEGVCELLHAMFDKLER